MSWLNDMRRVRPAPGKGLWQQTTPIMPSDDGSSDPTEDNEDLSDAPASERPDYQTVTAEAIRLLEEPFESGDLEGDNRIGEPLRSRRGHADSKIPKPELKKRELDWLQSSDRWTTPIGSGWKGVKVLGRGGYGIAGLWRYEGPERGHEWERAVREIVVKQSRAGVTSLQSEAELLAVVNSTKSVHFPRMYKHVIREEGQGTLAIDKKGREVHRVFLEFASGGDLYHYVNEFARNPRYPDQIPEEDIWGIFLCLAKAVSVLQRGHEGFPDVAPSTWNAKHTIVHFDVKPANILLAGKDDEHTLADFSLAYAVPDEYWLVQDKDYSNIGTPGWLAPEQQRCNETSGSNKRPFTDPNLPPECLRCGSHTNIYGIGLVIWCLMLNITHPPWETYEEAPYYISRLSEHLKKGETFGDELEDADCKYSNSLKILVLECLMQDYRYRPTVDNLLQRCIRGSESATEYLLAQDPAYFTKKEEIYRDLILDQSNSMSSSRELLPPTPTAWQTKPLPDNYWKGILPGVRAGMEERKARRRAEDYLRRAHHDLLYDMREKRTAAKNVAGGRAAVAGAGAGAGPNKKKSSSEKEQDEDEEDEEEEEQTDPDNPILIELQILMHYIKLPLTTPVQFLTQAINETTYPQLPLQYLKDELYACDHVSLQPNNMRLALPGARDPDHAHFDLPSNKSLQALPFINLDLTAQRPTVRLDVFPRFHVQNYARFPIQLPPDFVSVPWPIPEEPEAEGESEPRGAKRKRSSSGGAAAAAALRLGKRSHIGRTSRTKKMRRAVSLLAGEGQGSRMGVLSHRTAMSIDVSESVAPELMSISSFRSKKDDVMGGV